MFDGIPVITDDFVSDAQTQGAATTCSSIYAARFGMEGVMGLQNGELQVVEVGDLETKDAGPWRYWTQSPGDRIAVDGSGRGAHRCSLTRSNQAANVFIDRFSQIANCFLWLSLA